MAHRTTRQRSEGESSPDLDPRDRLILALYAELKAERETRAALEDALAHGVVSLEILQAIISDPVPVVTEEDIVRIERVLARDAARSAILAKDAPTVQGLRGGG
ncbi:MULTISPECIES: hypothetical protein [unclassified Ensifer]|uniref:hypothetical protein n=1 Tax=unclassified Ensifer TaxID=2633371 RepID=UPI000DD5C68E|nr:MULTISPECIES: hypothetical protein [unclassified Ensifer]MBD9495003.1 hypothetical protein [Ensifer sp. ENS01]MBD9521957.1 hypothetical protein [Ensifer sp. ENS02]